MDREMIMVVQKSVGVRVASGRQLAIYCVRLYYQGI